MIKNKRAIQKEIDKNSRHEDKFIQNIMKKENSKISALLEEKVPEGLQNTLDSAFAKSFALVFEKGTALIEKTYNKQKLKDEYQINEYTHSIKNNRKSLKVFSKKAATSKAVNELISGFSGIGLGILGIGVADIALFTGLMLKSIYEIALNYGFDYEKNDEKRFILLLIRASLSDKEEFSLINDEINYYIQNGVFESQSDIKSEIEKTSRVMSQELLYTKFIQGIPVIGALGGAYDLIYLSKINKYAEIKYRKRFLHQKKNV